MNEPSLKKKGILKAQYVYNAVLLLVLLLGVSYAVVNFLYNEEGTSGSLTSSLVKITVDEDTSFSLDNTSPVTDEVGLTGYSKTLTLTNTSTIDSLVNVTLNPDASNDIETSYIKYGLYINGTLKKTASLSDTSIYDGLILQGETIKIEVYLWVDSSYTGSGTIFNGTFSVTSTEAVMTMADYVTKLVDKDKGVYKVGNDYRYSGLDSDNYIWFNCKEGTTSGANNCEKWQIVGSLETKANSYANTYRRIKIVKVDSLDNQVFGDNNTFASSSLHTYLNGDYYTSLTTQSQKMIISSEWNVGSSVLTNTPASSLTSEQASKLYTKVGLLSASDLGYSTNTDNQTKALNDNDLYTNSWLKGSSYYTLTPVTDNTTSVIGNNATSITSLDVATATGIKPVVSLIPNVYIKGGNGTSKMPYELAIVDEEEHYSDVKVVGYITYDVNGQTVSSPKMQPIFADGSTIINRELPDVGVAKFKGWSTSQDGEVVYKKGDAFTETSDITLYAVWQQGDYLVDKIINSVGTSGLVAVSTDGGLYTDETTQTLRDYRFSGSNSVVTNNYVWFNDELWRIIGVMPTETEDGVTENLIKIIKATPLSAQQIPTTYTYNGVEMTLKYGDTYNVAYLNKSKYFNQTNLNDWTKAAVQYFLNDETEGSSSYYNSIAPIYQAMIQKSVYHLGNVTYNQNPQVTYEAERSGTIFTGNQATWIGNIGLMYPSDYGYAAANTYWQTTLGYPGFVQATAYRYDWLYDNSSFKWTISPAIMAGTDGVDCVMALSTEGHVSSYGVSGMTHPISPVLYLKSDVMIVDGTGLSGDPYLLEYEVLQ